MLPGHFGKVTKKKRFFFLENFDLGENSLSPRKGEFQRGAFKGDCKGGNNGNLDFRGEKSRLCTVSSVIQCVSTSVRHRNASWTLWESQKKIDFFFENFDLGENSLSPRKGEFQRGAFKGDSKAGYPAHRGIVRGKQRKTVRFYVFTS